MAPSIEDRRCPHGLQFDDDCILCDLEDAKEIKTLTIPDMSGDAYHEADGWSSSQLKHMAISPANFYALNLDPERQPREEKPAFKFGTLVHTLTLEPDNYVKEFVTLPTDINKRTNAGKAEFAQWSQENAGRKIITLDDLQLATNMADAVSNHEAAFKLLDHPEIEIEHSHWWRDDRTGALLKYRADARTPKAIIDLKTTAGPVDYETVQRAIWNYNYHTSAAHYLDGDAACHGTSHDMFILIFVSKVWPHELGVYYLDEDAIELGRRQNRSWLNRLVYCTEYNEWPPVNGGEVLEIGLPPYALKKLGA